MTLHTVDFDSFWTLTLSGISADDQYHCAGARAAIAELKSGEGVDPPSPDRNLWFTLVMA